MMELEQQRFKMAMLAAHPENAETILEMFKDGDGSTDLSAAEEEYEAVDPDSEVQQVLTDLQRLGFSLADM